MQKDIDTLFSHLWDNYIKVTPSALKVHTLLGGGEPIVNDHVAFRTYNLPKLGLEKLAAHFLALGYEQKGEYVFKAKKLYAKHFEHQDPDAPKVFISELKVEELSPAAQAIIHKLADQVPDHLTDTPAFLYTGAPGRSPMPIIRFCWRRASMRPGWQPGVIVPTTSRSISTS